MGVPEGRGLAELLNRDGAASAAVTRHAAGHDEGDGGGAGRSTVARDAARTAGQTLRFALGIEGFGGNDWVPSKALRDSDTSYDRLVRSPNSSVPPGHAQTTRTQVPHNHAHHTHVATLSTHASS